MFLMPHCSEHSTVSASHTSQSSCICCYALIGIWSPSESPVVVIIYIIERFYFKTAWKWVLAQRKENEVALKRAEMRMIWWMCGVKLQDRIPSKGLRESDDIISVLLQNRLRWYGHVLRKEDNDWVKKCMEYDVESARPRGRPKKTWREIVEKDCQARGLNRDMPWMKQIRDDRCEWVNVSSGTGWTGCPGQNP